MIKHNVIKGRLNKLLEVRKELFRGYKADSIYPYEYFTYTSKVKGYEDLSMLGVNIHGFKRALGCPIKLSNYWTDNYNTLFTQVRVNNEPRLYVINLKTLDTWYLKLDILIKDYKGYNLEGSSYIFNTKNTGDKLLSINTSNIIALVDDTTELSDNLITVGLLTPNKVCADIFKKGVKRYKKKYRLKINSQDYLVKG